MRCLRMRRVVIGEGWVLLDTILGYVKVEEVGREGMSNEGKGGMLTRI